MDIQSVRDLKAEIAAEVIPPAVKSIYDAGGFSITSFSLGGPAKADPLVALGVAAGEGGRDLRLAVRLQRRSLMRSQQLIEDIRRRSKGEADVRFVGRIAVHALPWYRSRLRPLQPGISVGHYQVTAGTLGAIARDRNGGKPVILSNNHVLARENNAAAGDDILQQGIFDGGKRAEDAVGTLSRWIELKAGQPNHVDAAIATITDGINANRTNYQDMGALRGRRNSPIRPGLLVQKVGRTSGFTQGRITAIEVDSIVVTYEMGTLSFDDQIEIESTTDRSFSAGGDSGSLILDDEFRGLGLLFAGSETGGANGHGVTYANPIGPVLDQLAIDLEGS